MGDDAFAYFISDASSMTFPLQLEGRSIGSRCITAAVDVVRKAGPDCVEAKARRTKTRC
jgi:hypothetical protein